MISPQELKDVQFDKAVFGGYDMAAVDETFAQVIADYTALVKENGVLKNKLKLLASTVEEYRSVDEAMRKALITAQNMANDMVKEAQEKSNDLIKNASAIASARVADLAAKIAEEEERLKRAQTETAAFVDGIILAYKNQVEKIMSVRPNSEQAKHDSVEDTLSIATDEINKCVANAIENIKEYEDRAVISNIPVPPQVTSTQGDEADTVGNVLESQENEPAVFEVDINKSTSPIDFSKQTSTNDADLGATRKFVLDDLKFGRNYDFDDE